tara:strand:+ start:6550 stop:6729 length:180 start_codon:yes stop_codon:yes gene_type:complete
VGIAIINVQINKHGGTVSAADKLNIAQHHAKKIIGIRFINTSVKNLNRGEMMRVEYPSI